MHAAFEFQARIGACTMDFSDDFLVATHHTFAGGENVDFPPPRFGITLIHAKKIARKECGLIPTRACAHFENDAALVSGIFR
jgi:hypothetical protein